MPLSYVASNGPKHRLSSDSRRWILSPSRPNSSSWHHGHGMDRFGHGQVASLTQIGNRLVKPATVMEGSNAMD
ncbi:hypothetical protein V6N11_081754 [Hibiscus sabdariffa]|uniref:Uncharacterized protein n=1 Tax=Hibiscus sabdariffa TaxID=183260 RepID=A0ABR2Q7I0_9ROSI